MNPSSVLVTAISVMIRGFLLLVVHALAFFGLLMAGFASGSPNTSDIYMSALLASSGIFYAAGSAACLLPMAFMKSRSWRDHIIKAAVLLDIIQPAILFWVLALLQA